jgi:hypothetical protein
VQIELRLESHTRWLMWTLSGARWVRRKGFASPHLDHAKRTAEDWYGAPVKGWQPSSAPTTSRTRRVG